MENLRQVDSNVWRSGRPTSIEDFNWVNEHVKAVISLEGLDEDYKEVKELAPTPVDSLPITTWQIYVSGISLSYLNRIMANIISAPKPVLVHCQHGEDRTGLIIAAWRVESANWSKEDAMSEALSCGYRRYINFGLNKTWDAFIVG